MGGGSRASKKNYVPDDIKFQTKPEIALNLIDRALSNEIRVAAWTFDELYGRDGRFLDGLEDRGQVFVGEIPSNFHGWLRRPRVLESAPRNAPISGRGLTEYPRLGQGWPSHEVRDLLRHSPVFQRQKWQRYRIKNTDKGPEVWEIKWAVLWRKDARGLPDRRQCLIVARNVLTGEIKYFLSNRVPGERAAGRRVTVRWLLRVAFGRWSIESCFRQGKEELGMDHYEVRGWRCVHRHFYVTQLSHLFCARMRQEYDDPSGPQEDRISVEQIRSAMNVWLDASELPPKARRKRYQNELDKQAYYQHRNRQARRSHTKTRRKELLRIGIDVDRIKSCVTDSDSS